METAKSMGKYWDSARPYVGLIVFFFFFKNIALHPEVVTKVDSQINYDNLDKIYFYIVLPPYLEKAFVSSLKEKYGNQVDLILVDMSTNPFQGLDLSRLSFFVSLLEKGEFFELNLEVNSLVKSLYNDSVFNAIVWQNCQVLKERLENVDQIMSSLEGFMRPYLSDLAKRPTFYIPDFTR